MERGQSCPERIQGDEKADIPKYPENPTEIHYDDPLMDEMCEKEHKDH